MLPAFAQIAQLQDRCPEPLASDQDLARAQAALDDASAKIRAEAQTSWCVLPPGGRWQGAWDSAVTYRAGDVVVDLAGAYWQSLTPYTYRDPEFAPEYFRRHFQPPAEDTTAWAAFTPAGPNAFALDPSVPDIIVTVCLAVALRAVTNPEQTTGVGVGGYHESFAPTAGDGYLSPLERKLVRKAAGYRGLWAQGTSRGRVETSFRPWDERLRSATYADGTGAGDPFLGGAF